MQMRKSRVVHIQGVNTRLGPVMFMKMWEKRDKIMRITSKNLILFLHFSFPSCSFSLFFPSIHDFSSPFILLISSLVSAVCFLEETQTFFELPLWLPSFIYFLLFFIALLFPPRPKLLSPIRPCVSHSHAHVNASQIHKPHPAAALEPSPPLPSLARAHARLV